MLAFTPILIKEAVCRKELEEEYPCMINNSNKKSLMSHVTTSELWKKDDEFN